MNDGPGDGFLGGRIRIRQPHGGFRSGLDAVLLAAAVPARDGDEILELGSGSGVASLCLAQRVRDCRVVGVEIVPDLVELSNTNACNNGLEHRTRFVEGDALDLPKPLRKSFAHVFCNPPFHSATGQKSPHRERALALQDEGKMGAWLEVAQKRVRAKGTLTAIIRADRIAEALRALPPEGLCILPLWPRAGESAKRVVLRWRKSSRAPLALVSGVVLHDANGHYTGKIEAILRDGASLALA